MNFMIFLNTTFDDEENAILSGYINKYNQETQIFYSIKIESLSGVSNPNRMISVGGLYLLEEKDEPREWYMGDLNNGKYDFGGKHISLEDALYGL